MANYHPTIEADIFDALTNLVYGGNVAGDLEPWPPGGGCKRRPARAPEETPGDPREHMMASRATHTDIMKREHDELFLNTAERVVQKACGRKKLKWEPSWSLNRNVPFKPNPTAEALLRKSTVKWEFGDDKAHNQPRYNFVEDIIESPMPHQYVTGEDYYATLFHELAHSTGAKHRLNRYSLNEPRFTNPFFGLSQKSAFLHSYEETVAEMASTFVMAALGVDKTDQAAAYLQDQYFATLNHDMELISNATLDARAAAYHILDGKG